MRNCQTLLGLFLEPTPSGFVLQRNCFACDLSLSRHDDCSAFIWRGLRAGSVLKKPGWGSLSFVGVDEEGR